MQLFVVTVPSSRTSKMPQRSPTTTWRKWLSGRQRPELWIYLNNSEYVYSWIACYFPDLMFKLTSHHFREVGCIDEASTASRDQDSADMTQQRFPWSKILLSQARVCMGWMTAEISQIFLQICGNVLFDQRLAWFTVQANRVETEYLDKKIAHSLKLVCMTLHEDFVIWCVYMSVYYVTMTITDLNEVQCERQVC